MTPTRALSAQFGGPKAAATHLASAPMQLLSKSRMHAVVTAPEAASCRGSRPPGQVQLAAISGAASELDLATILSGPERGHLRPPTGVEAHGLGR